MVESELACITLDLVLLMFSTVLIAFMTNDIRLISSEGVQVLRKTCIAMPSADCSVPFS